MILLNKSYEDKIIEGYIIYNEEEKSFDTIPKLNTDIQLVISYINIGFDSETMIANQVWGFLPKDCWIESEIECPLNLKKATLKLKTELEPGSWRLDRGNQWKAYYNSRTKWICIGTPEIVIGDEYIVFLENAVSALNSSGELKALWMRV